jgi:hypothetical protein
MSLSMSSLVTPCFGRCADDEYSMDPLFANTKTAHFGYVRDRIHVYGQHLRGV